MSLIDGSGGSPATDQMIVDYRLQTVWSKVMFLHLSVCSQAGGGVCIQGRICTHGGLPLREGVCIQGGGWGGLHPGVRGVCIQGGPLHPGGGGLHRRGAKPHLGSRRYASYWNAFLCHAVFGKVGEIVCLASNRIRIGRLLTVSRSIRLGGCLPRGGCGTSLHSTPPPRGQTATFENITLRKLRLRAVKIRL